jgi:hypothetical protein
MDTVNAETSDTPNPETDAERQRRNAWEADRIAEARADVTAGRLVGSAKVKAWIDSIGTDHEPPVPYSDRCLRRIPDTKKTSSSRMR